MNQNAINEMKYGTATSGVASNYWNVVETFHDGEVAIEVSKSSGSIPKFGLRIGWRTDTRGGAWLPCGGDSNYTNIVERLLRMAQAFVKHELEEWQKVEDERNERRQKEQDEQRAKDAAKKRQYEQNKDARREDNRARAHGGGGGKGKKGK